MHSHCFGQYTRYHYTCPICAKSLGDMSVYFRMIDSMVAHDRTSLPPTVRDRVQVRLGFRIYVRPHFLLVSCIQPFKCLRC